MSGGGSARCAVGRSCAAGDPGRWSLGRWPRRARPAGPTSRRPARAGPPSRRVRPARLRIPVHPDAAAEPAQRLRPDAPVHRPRPGARPAAVRPVPLRARRRRAVHRPHRPGDLPVRPGRRTVAVRAAARGRRLDIQGRESATQRVAATVAALRAIATSSGGDGRRSAGTVLIGTKADIQPGGGPGRPHDRSHDRPHAACELTRRPRSGSPSGCWPTGASDRLEREDQRERRARPCPAAGEGDARCGDRASAAPTRTATGSRGSGA